MSTVYGKTQPTGQDRITRTRLLPSLIDPPPRNNLVCTTHRAWLHSEDTLASPEPPADERKEYVNCGRRFLGVDSWASIPSSLRFAAEVASCLRHAGGARCSHGHVEALERANLNVWPG